jgi:hypothetical protein
VCPTDSTGLAAGSADRVLIVDTWHHIERRTEYAKHRWPAARRLVLIVDFTQETDSASPQHRIRAEQVIEEPEARADATIVDETLPDQYVKGSKKPALQWGAGRGRCRYGPVALVAGAAEGLGAAFAALAARGLDLVLVDVHAPHSLAGELSRAHGVRATAVALDLGQQGVGATALRLTEELEIGLVVYNAAFAPMGPWLLQSLADQQRTLDVNARGALELAQAFAPAMVARGHGGLLFVGSLAGLIAHPTTAVYGASKAFWCGSRGARRRAAAARCACAVACPGAVRTPGSSDGRRCRACYRCARDVAERSLERLGADRQSRSSAPATDSRSACYVRCLAVSPLRCWAG